MRVRFPPAVQNQNTNMIDDQNIELQEGLDLEEQEAQEQDKELERKKELRESMHMMTRVSPEIGAQVLAICNEFGFSVFHALRMLLEVLVRMKDDKHNLTPELMRIIRQFENIPGWSKSICIADPNQEFGIVEAFYVLGAKGKTGNRLVHTERPMLEGDDNWQGTYNIQQMLERFIELVNPSLYRHLRLVAVALGTESMLDTIQRIADEFMENPDEVELRLQFEQNDYHRGAQMTDRTHYKRPYTPSEEHLQKTLFDEDENN